MSVELFALLLVLGVFLGVPGLIAWLGVALRGRILRRRGRRNASKIVLAIEFVCIFAYSFVVLAASTTIVSRLWLTSHPVACEKGKIIALSLCQEDACTDGFQVENLSVPHTMYNTRPVVRDLTDQERAIFRDIIQRFEQEAPNGIYQLLAYPGCLRDGWRDAPCLAEATTTRLTDVSDSCLRPRWRDARRVAEATIMRLADASDAQTLVQYRTEWLAKERQAHRAVTIQSWYTSIVLSLLTLFSLAWPWILVTLKASLKRDVVYMLVAAIPVQVIVFAMLELYRSPRFTGMTVEWSQLALFCESLILLFVPLQFGYLILQKLKPEAQ